MDHLAPPQALRQPADRAIGAAASVPVRFDRRRVEVNGVTINAVTAGSAAPVLLLHGYPQTHAMWHAVAPALATQYRVVCADLRGYGDSSQPPGVADHSNYSKRAMAQDMAELMTALGHDRFHVVGHDRGGRVAHRLAADHGDRVASLTVLDIAPTLAMYERTTMDFARAYYHWFLFIQSAPIPEKMLAAVGLEAIFQRHVLGASSLFHPRAWAEYQRCFTPAMIHASCEDYRASAGIDLEHDRADRAAERRLAMPVQVLWGANGVVGRLFDPLALWREVADEVGGFALDCAHFIAEERPAETVSALRDFLGRQPPI
jgi:haloacetate dehalogenase